MLASQPNVKRHLENQGIDGRAELNVEVKNLPK
jgi:hypothetical protein